MTISDTPVTDLMPSDLPPLSDEAAVEILEFLYELVFRFEVQYFAQIGRFYDELLELFEPAPPTNHDESSFDQNLPF